MAIRAAICDFGGVLPSPLIGSFMAFQDHRGIPMEALGRAMARSFERDGKHPLFELEMGKMTEADFLDELRTQLAEELGHTPELHNFKELYFDALDPNAEMIELMAEISRSETRTAMLTNNVREWEPLWRAKLPVDEIFELVVDSAFVGLRKPDPAIYELTLRRLREHDPAALDDLVFSECMFIDDIEANCDASRELGIATVHFIDNEQAIPEIRALLAG
ncbi:HAD-IA family hydrolase [soil metagenome]